jgi:ribonuclease D
MFTDSSDWLTVLQGMSRDHPAPHVAGILSSCTGTDDIITLQRDFGLRFATLFETQTAAELCGIRRSPSCWFEFKTANP